MQSVLVLIAPPGSSAIGSDILAALRDAGAAAPTWLAEGEALEVPDFPGRPAFITSIGKAPVDINLLPAQGRRKKLLIADMDSTMIQQECIDELGDMAGVGERIKEITIRAMRGELDFEGALNERVSLLRRPPEFGHRYDSP